MDLIIAKTQTTISGPRDPGNAIVVNKQGLQGAAGVASFQFIAGVNLSGQRLIRVDATTGKAIYADNLTLADAGNVIGVSTGAAALNATVTVLAFGEMSESYWTWTPGAALYVGANGVITETPPESPALFSQCIGFAIAATAIFINIEIPIIL
jgi:hypothetical protein